jgi:hypothetical protein
MSMLCLWLNLILLDLEFMDTPVCVSMFIGCSNEPMIVINEAVVLLLCQLKGRLPAKLLI